MRPPRKTQRSVSPTTTGEQDLRTAGQRRINMIWEYTQAIIAAVVVTTTCVGIGMGKVFPPEWWTVTGLVVGFYFGRTNHARVGDYPPVA